MEFQEMVGRVVAIEGARNYRALRAKGMMVRKTIDVIIATFCLLHGYPLLHADRDFDPIERHLGLQAEYGPTAYSALRAVKSLHKQGSGVLYTVADEDGPKRKVANDLLEWMSSANALIALQTLGEFYAVSTRKYNLAPSLARELVVAWQTLFPTIAASPSAVLAGIDTSINHRLSFWDALLLVTLKATQVTVFFNGQGYPLLMISNKLLAWFKPG
jgi:predicted nucleic acid-binding protein